MTFLDLANELVAGCRDGREKENLSRLYAADAVSVEAMDMGNGRETVGIDGIRGKHDWFDAAFEVLESTISDPMPHGEDRFGVIFEVKTRNRETGAVDEMKEIAVYHVADGKIVREEFFYGA
ncbi:nuclear transport factor 2 family protein [Jannaschia sp. M317]|uniref:nuclear transport factor 2 family protein n=1 Tax=Jannaschia sp. M317 TaxID=2867011 RepID=UPI0021A5E5F4|nr:nuclear transport factor 2 family protein [Jannaschia sp. M317]UWQ17990.1 nuclear transport factor 2 family protein [Jannaschia sp. M317]